MCVGIETSVGSDESVVVEVVVACGIASVVASVGEYPSARDRTDVSQSLIYKVPNISALIFRIFADDIPIFLESSH